MRNLRNNGWIVMAVIYMFVTCGCHESVRSEKILSRDHIEATEPDRSLENEFYGLIAAWLPEIPLNERESRVKTSTAALEFFGKGSSKEMVKAKIQSISKKAPSQLICDLGSEVERWTIQYDKKNIAQMRVSFFLYYDANSLLTKIDSVILTVQ